MSHQDWKPVTLGKKKKSVGTKRTVQKGIARPTNTSTFGHGIMGTTAGQRGRKLEDETETFRVEKVSLSMSKKIQRARMDKGISQKELARLMNVKPSTIQMYENGKAVPSGRVIQNMERQLGLAYGALSGKKRKGKGGKKKGKK